MIVGQANEPPPTTPKAGLLPKKVMLCIWWDWEGVLYYELLPEDQMINSNKYCSQLDQLKAALDERHLELVNRKCIIFHQDNARLRFFDDQAKTVTAWLGSSESSAIFTRHCTFRFPFISVSTKFSWWKNISIPWKTVKGTWNSSLLKKIKHFGKMEL